MKTMRLLNLPDEDNEKMTETANDVPPFKLTPAFKDYIWGGEYLKKHYNKQTDLPIVAESWELSSHPDGQSIIASGKFTGVPFGEFVRKFPELIFANGEANQEFPILIKLIDAKDKLSIQVHPNDDYARQIEGESGKTEAWVILDCDKDAFVYLGFEKSMTTAEVQQHIHGNTLPDTLHKRHIKPGDVIFIPAGTVHAIGKGIILAEVQQNSNSTYRVYDFGRLDADGNLRELHISKALDVMTLDSTEFASRTNTCLAVTDEYVLEQLVSCAYFNVLRLHLNGRYIFPMNRTRFSALFCINGEVVVESESDTLDIRKGDTVFVPSLRKRVHLKGSGQVLIIN
jgi:mannose-6-phosphate isomerase